MDKNIDTGKVILNWTFPEYIKPDRKKTWYILMAVLAGALLTYSVVTVNFLFAVIIVVGAIILMYQQAGEPRELDCQITDQGVVIDQDFFAYSELKSFYILYNPPQLKKLYIDLKSAIKPRLSISLENFNPLKVRDVLLQYLDEDLDKEDEPLSEVITRWLKI